MTKAATLSQAYLMTTGEVIQTPPRLVQPVSSGFQSYNVFANSILKPAGWIQTGLALSLMAYPPKSHLQWRHFYLFQEMRNVVPMRFFRLQLWLKCPLSPTKSILMIPCTTPAFHGQVPSGGTEQIHIPKCKQVHGLSKPCILITLDDDKMLHLF